MNNYNRQDRNGTHRIFLVIGKIAGRIPTKRCSNIKMGVLCLHLKRLKKTSCRAKRFNITKLRYETG
ncbi:unnamed protein product [Arctia plantaginis]|uniref:Uncharacterized protein n=1 Tax=Arctia plantaginis TaxID=874455 RepID=A0A8S1A1Y5_ARCPL|nr:unnamed protein product [Arctia plantaginis]